MTTVGEDSEHPRRALVTPETITPNSVAPVPVAPVSVTPEASYPAPPERGSFDDDDLVRAVDRHLDDTATVDLIGILQAQMVMRAAEATRFADWEDQMRRLGTDEAYAAIEKTRMRFTGVIPVITPEMAALARQAAAAVVHDPASSATPPLAAGTAPASPASPSSVVARPTAPVLPIVSVDSAPVPIVPAALSNGTASNRTVSNGTPADDTLSKAAPGATTSTTSRALAIGTTGVAAALVVVAVVLAFTSESSVATAVLAVLGVIGAAWLGVVAGRLALRRGSSEATPTASIVALILGAAVGEGFVDSSTRGFSWTGYLLRAIHVQGVSGASATGVALGAALVVGFAVLVLVSRIGTAPQPE